MPVGASDVRFHGFDRTWQTPTVVSSFDLAATWDAASGGSDQRRRSHFGVLARKGQPAGFKPRHFRRPILSGYIASLPAPKPAQEDLAADLFQRTLLPLRLVP